MCPGPPRRPPAGPCPQGGSALPARPRQVRDCACAATAAAAGLHAGLDAGSRSPDWYSLVPWLPPCPPCPTGLPAELIFLPSAPVPPRLTCLLTRLAYPPASTPTHLSTHPLAAGTKPLARPWSAAQPPRTAPPAHTSLTAIQGRGGVPSLRLPPSAYPPPSPQNSMSGLPSPAGGRASPYLQQRTPLLGGAATAPGSPHEHQRRRAWQPVPAEAGGPQVRKGLGRCCSAGGQGARCKAPRRQQAGWGPMHVCTLALHPTASPGNSSGWVQGGGVKSLCPAP